MMDLLVSSLSSSKQVARGTTRGSGEPATLGSGGIAPPVMDALSVHEFSRRSAHGALAALIQRGTGLSGSAAAELDMYRQLQHVLRRLALVWPYSIPVWTLLKACDVRIPDLDTTSTFKRTVLRYVLSARMDYNAFFLQPGVLRAHARADVNMHKYKCVFAL